MSRLIGGPYCMDPILAFVGTAEVVTNKTAPQNTVP